jgi:hypothetical protein
MGRPKGPKRRVHHVEMTINRKTIRGAYERIGDSILVTTIGAQKFVAFDGGSEEDIAHKTLGELFMAPVNAPAQSGPRSRE